MFNKAFDKYVLGKSFTTDLSLLGIPFLKHLAREMLSQITIT
jgi:hypothetical protein